MAHLLQLVARNQDPYRTSICRVDSCMNCHCCLRILPTLLQLVNILVLCEPHPSLVDFMSSGVFDVAGIDLVQGVSNLTRCKDSSDLDL